MTTINMDVSKVQNGLENGLANGLEVSMPETIFRYVQPLVKPRPWAQQESVHLWQRVCGTVNEQNNTWNSEYKGSQWLKIIIIATAGLNQR